MQHKALFPLVAGLWCLVLMIYILAGIPLATFHGDESMLIYSSRDFVTAFIDGTPGDLATSPPYEVDSDDHLRILNGTLTRHMIGLTWYLGGMSEADLPTLWHWGFDYYQNVERGARPARPMLIAGRIHAAVALASSVVVIFLIALRSGDRLLAFPASALYALNPAILLNGRRAMQEGVLLLFGLLAILLAIIISQKRAAAEERLWPWWGAFVLASGLALASKHSGLLFVIAALGWILLVQVVREGVRRLPGTILRLAGAGLLIALLFIALSPALWQNPPARLQNLLEVRKEMLEMQVDGDPMAVEARVRQILTQPFMTPAVHYEQPIFWPDAEPITKEIERYHASLLDGVYPGRAGGMILTLLAVAGLLFALLPARSRLRRSFTAGLLGWTGVIVLYLLANPLPWQRYYLPWIPIMTLLAGIGLLNSLRLLVIPLKSMRLARFPAGHETSR